MNYRTAFEELNEQQRQAVTTLEGPVMVVAGPGTGKTQLLSTRAAHILSETDAGPQNILCLTYTNEATHNMRRRMLDLIGEHADQIVVKTFHSFAAEIMNIYSDSFYNSASMKAAPDAVQIEIIENILSELPLNNPLALKFAGQYTLTKDVKNGLQIVKEAGLTPDKLKALLKLNLAYIDKVEADFIAAVPERISRSNIDNLRQAVEDLPDLPSTDMKPFKTLPETMKDSFDIAYQQADDIGKTTPISEWKRQFVTREKGEMGLHKERKINNWWLALAGVYDKYRQQMHKRGYFDYSDMLVEVISALEQKDDLRSEIQERFSFVMIDEFQDTNEAQLRLAHLVADHILDEGRPNLMVVGDDDQSIFKFQGADINNMLDFEKTYPTAVKIVLKTNYRSSQDIIDVSDKIIDQATYRLVTIDKTLSKELKADTDLPAHIDLKLYPTQSHQLVGVAERISNLRQDNPDKEIAVIASKHKSLELMAAALQQTGTAVRYERSRDILSLEPIRTIILILETISLIRSGRQPDAQLAKLLRHPMFKVKPVDFVETAVASKGAWFEFDSQVDEINNARDWLSALAASQTDSAQEMIEMIIGLSEDLPSPVANYYWQDKTVDYQYLETLSAIQQLRLKAREYAGESNTATIEQLLRFVAIHDENEITIADQSVFMTAGNVVHLLTAYKAKGLEFDEVFIIDATDKEWSPRGKRGRLSPSNLPLRKSGDDRDDFIRLMYVAATRAKTGLNISTFIKSDDGSEILASPYITALGEPDTINSGDTVKRIQILEKTLPSVELISNDTSALLADKLKNYQLSVTHLTTFLDVVNGGPKAFYERNLLRLPDVKSPHQSFGTAIHAALNQAQQIVNQGRELAPESLDEVLEKSLKTELSDSSEVKRYLSHGRLVIKQLLSLSEFKLKAGGMPERSINNIQIGEAILRGTLDRVDADSKTVLITDYKTGNPLKSLTTKSKGGEGIKAWKHRTQLVFYAMLAQHSDLNRPVINTQMTFVEAEFNDQLHKQMSPTKQEIDELAEVIDAVWRRIMQLDFPSIDSYSQDMNGIMSFIDDLKK